MSDKRTYAERYAAGEVCVEGCDEGVVPGQPCQGCIAKEADMATVRMPPYANCVRIDQPENAGRHPAPNT